MPKSKDELKKEAAEKAVEFVHSGMIVGLGTGSTTFYAIEKIAHLLKDRKIENIKCIPTSKNTEELAMQFGIPLTDFNDHQKINVTIDGADEVDSELNLIKGGGGALLREKVVAQASDKEIIIVDDSKLSNYLGETWAVPIEVLQFAMPLEKKYLESLGARVKLRTAENGKPFITDENNFILDSEFGTIKEPEKLALQLEKRAGIVEHGMFINLAAQVIAASGEGIKILKK